MENRSAIEHPAHYNSGKIEVIEAIEDWKLSYHLGNAVKYIARAGKKDPAKEVEDLEKATWYLKRAIEILRATNEGRSATRPNDMNPRRHCNCWISGKFDVTTCELHSSSVTDASTSSKDGLQADTAKTVTEWRAVCSKCSKQFSEHYGPHVVPYCYPYGNPKGLFTK